MNSEIRTPFYRLSVKALILDETRTKFLILKESNGKFDLPGGGLDWGELPLDGLRRELMEEMGLAIASVKQNPSYFLTFLKNKPDGRYIANVVYEVTLASFDFIPSKECVGFQFVTASDALAFDLSSGISILGTMFDPKNHIAK